MEKARFDRIMAYQEIRTLITALGTGIGQDDFKIENLRYHKIVLMTDADVDGSHIRTLLLTFFYRQMPELVLRGHIYIAQPPLYKVKKGKQERYLKDERALEEYIFNKALDGWTLTLPQGGEVKGPDLVREMKKWGEVKHLFAKLDRRGYARPLVDGLLSEGGSWLTTASAPAKPFRNSLIACRPWAWASARSNPPRRLTPLWRLPRKGSRKPNPSFWTPPPTASASPACTSAAPITLWIDEHVAHWGEFRRLQALREDLATFRGGALKLRRTSAVVAEPEEGEEPVVALKQAKEMVFNNAEDLLVTIIEEGKKGVSIQRYKGLGEMNPEQLWETTMDSERRTLLQVRVEDAVQADEIFTVLMGDAVEPRRRFIEDNALLAENLDV